MEFSFINTPRPKRVIQLSLWILITLGCAALACCAAETPLLLTFGDSVTAARGSTPTYSDILKSELLFREQPINVINAGVPGNTTEMALKRFTTDVLQKQPDIVIVMFGINDAAVDVWKNPPAVEARVSLQTYRANLRSLVQTLKQQGKRVVLMTPNPLSWTDTTRKLYGKPPYKVEHPDGFNEVLRGYVQAVRDLASELGVALVDLFTLFKTQEASYSLENSSLCPDGMHPSFEGQRLIADALVRELAVEGSGFSRKP